MDKILYTSKRLQINLLLIPGFGFMAGYEHKYTEAHVLLGCFLISVEIKQHKNKKRK